MAEEKTQPKPRFPEGTTPDPNKLTANRYGTYEMCQIWGGDETFEFSLKVQGQAASTLSEMHPDIVPPEHAQEINEKASLKYIDPDSIRKEEERTGHDGIAINNNIDAQVSKGAKLHINKFKTTADTTQPAKALQTKSSLETIADSVENLRDITIEKSRDWIDKPFMDTSHLYDALPTVAGRPLAHYIELLQTSLDLLNIFYEKSIMGKWGDATGNHHSASVMGVDGIALQEKYCKDLGINHTIAPAQIPGLEFEFDIAFIMSRTSETMNNLANYIAWGKSDDVNVFFNASPKKKKGSSAMPHKDIKGGNPTVEEQTMSLRNYLAGNLVTAVMNCQMPYARNLAASSNTRINFEDGFKFMDNCIRRLANTVYWLGLNEERSKERVTRSFGVVTSNWVMAYLTDHRKTENPMSRKDAHDLLGELATKAYNDKTPFFNFLVNNLEVSSRIDSRTLLKISDPLNYYGESKRIVQMVADQYHKKKTL